MKKHAFAAIAGIIGVAFVVAIALQQRQIRNLSLKLDDALESATDLERDRADAEHRLRAELEEQKALADAEKAQLQEALDRLQAELDRAKQRAADEKARLEKELAEAAAPPSPPAAPLAPAAAESTVETTADDSLTTPPPGKEYFKQISNMMKNPAMKEMVRSQQKSLLDMTYQAMFDALDLTDDQEAKLKDLLLEKQMKQVDLGLEMMDGDLTGEQREDVNARIEAANAEYDKAIKDLLGEEDYDWYKAYEDTKNERMQLMMFNQSLAEDNRLTVDQQDALTLAMFDARSEFKSLNQLNNSNTMNPGQFTPEQIDALIRDLRAVADQYIERATPILTPQQLEQFRAYLDQQRGMQEMGLRMMLQMFGDQNQSAPAESGTAAP